eukprot:SAG31_NODE_62_length_28678_cov_21.548270_11_plen_179_part_00
MQHVRALTCATVRQHPPEQIRAKPRHSERGTATGATAHRRPAIRVPGQLDIAVLFYEGHHLQVAVRGERPVRCVILEPPLAALRVAATTVCKDRDIYISYQYIIYHINISYIRSIYQDQYINISDQYIIYQINISRSIYQYIRSIYHISDLFAKIATRSAGTRPSAINVSSTGTITST